MKNNKPEVRFNGFKNDWKQHKVGEFYSFKNGLNKEKEFFGRGTPIVNFTDVFHNRGILSEKLKGKVELTKKEIDNFKVQKGDIFFTRTSETIEEIGYPSVMIDQPVDTVFSGFVLRGRAIDEDPLELDYKRYVFFTNSFREEMTKKSSMTTRALTSGTAIREMVFNYPESRKEQAKIGSFFKQIDEAIALQQQELTTLKQSKQGFLQKMFPNERETVPELRFPGFHNEWEEKDLGHLASIYDGTHQTPQYVDEGVMFLSVENIGKLSSNKYISEEAFRREFKIKPEKGDVLMTRIGSVGVANVINTDQDYSYYVSLALIKSTQLHPYFLKYNIHSPYTQNEIWKLTLHIAFPKKINKNEISNIRIKLPCFEEQTKIGEFFKQLDQIIELHEKELEALKETKKAFLQKMFV